MSPHFTYRQLVTLLFCLITYITALCNTNFLQNNSFAYIGQPDDSNHQSMILGGYRHYNLSHRFFLKQDSFTPFINTHTHNCFNYSASNPVMDMDPSGHDQQPIRLTDEQPDAFPYEIPLDMDLPEVLTDLILSAEQYERMGQLIASPEGHEAEIAAIKTQYNHTIAQHSPFVRSILEPLHDVINETQYSPKQQLAAMTSISDLTRMANANGGFIPHFSNAQVLGMEHAITDASPAFDIPIELSDITIAYGQANPRATAQDFLTIRDAHLDSYAYAQAQFGFKSCWVGTERYFGDILD